MELQGLHDWPHWDFHRRTGISQVSSAFLPDDRIWFSLSSGIFPDNGICFFFLQCDHQIINRGILQVIGVEVGKGLNLPL